MPKTKRDLLYALADRIGGEHGQRMREALAKPVFQELRMLQRTYSDEEFAAELERMERDTRAALARAKEIELDKPATWGLAN